MKNAENLELINSNIIEEYKKLDQRCLEIMEKIKNRKIKSCKNSAS